MKTFEKLSTTANVVETNEVYVSEGVTYAAVHRAITNATTGVVYHSVMISISGSEKNIGVINQTEQNRLVCNIDTSIITLSQVTQVITTATEIINDILSA